MKAINEKLSYITPEEIEEQRMGRLNRIKSLTLEYQLGYFVGDYIVDHYLPTLSTDPIRSKNCIEVSDEDFMENERLSTTWSNRYEWGKFPDIKQENNVNSLWEAYRAHSEKLSKKYLPEVLKCTFNPINVENLDEFKKGIADALWDSDICAYSTDLNDIKIYHDDEYYLTYIELKRYDED